MKLYESLARAIQFKQNCNESYKDDAEKELKKLIDELPHGSGINYDYHIDESSIPNRKIEFSNIFDVMDENGMYATRISFRVVIIANLMYGFDIAVLGRFGKYQDIREYLLELYSDSLAEEVRINV